MPGTEQGTARLGRRWSPASRAAVLLAVGLLVDDAVEVHEIVGGFLADGWVARGWTPPPWLPLRSQDLGELTVWAVIGLVLGPWLVFGFLRSSAAPRQLALRLALAGPPGVTENTCMMHAVPCTMHV